MIVLFPLYKLNTIYNRFIKIYINVKASSDNMHGGLFMQKVEF